MEALFSLLQAIPKVVTTSRRAKLWSDVEASAQPALFMCEQGPEVMTRQSENLMKRSLDVTLFVYTRADDPNPSIVPSTLLNNILDAIELRLEPRGPDILKGKNTLGNLCSHCFIDSIPFKDAGDFDGQGLALIKIKILVP